MKPGGLFKVAGRPWFGIVIAVLNQKVKKMDMSKTKLILGLLGATAAGLLLGLMLAPEKGADLRKSISQAADNCLEDVSNWIGKGKKVVEKLTEPALEKKAAPDSKNGVLQE